MIRLCAHAKCDPSALATNLTHEMQYDFGHKTDQKIARKLVCSSRSLKVKDRAQNIFKREQCYHWVTSQPEFCLLTASGAAFTSPTESVFSWCFCCAFLLYFSQNEFQFFTLSSAQVNDITKKREHCSIIGRNKKSRFSYWVLGWSLHPNFAVHERTIPKFSRKPDWCDAWERWRLIS